MLSVYLLFRESEYLQRQWNVFTRQRDQFTVEENYFPQILNNCFPVNKRIGRYFSLQTLFDLKEIYEVEKSYTDII